MADALLNSQIRVVTFISNFLKNTKEKRNPATLTVTYYEARLQLLQRYYDEMFTRHDQLLPYADEKKAHDYFSKNYFTIAENAYIEALADLNAEIERMRRPAAVAPTNNPPAPVPRAPVDHVKVPRVSLPSFSGKHEEWESFKQRFTSLIINKPEHSDVDKLQYLLSTLQGSAAARLQNLEVVGENFKIAWDKLDKRYGNQRRRLETHLEKLIQLNSVRPKNVQDLSELLDKVEVSVRALEELGCNAEHYNHWLVHCILRKLDEHTKETWKISQEGGDAFYTYSDLTKFIERRIETLDAESDKPESRKAGGSASKSTSKSKSHNSSATAAHSALPAAPNSTSTEGQLSCPLCQAAHSINRCDQFNGLNPSQRFEFCKKSKLCLNCLRKAHGVADCRSPNRCSLCKQRHHTKLHFDGKMSHSILPTGEAKQPEANYSSETSPENPSHFTASTSANSAIVDRTVLLATAKIMVCDSFGNSIFARALIDPGAQRSFITERLSKQLTLERRSTSVAIFGVGGQASSHSHGEVTLSIRSQADPSFKCTCLALIMNELTRLLPPRNVPAKEWPHLKGLQLADPTFASPGKIDVILGADVYGLILRDGIRRGSADAPIALATVFGWVLTGAVFSSRHCAAQTAITAFHTVTDDSLSQIVCKFWETEEVPLARALTPEEEYCENYFSSTYVRNAEGRFIVRLPFSRREIFSDSRDIAVACLIRSEKRRHRNSELQTAYSTFMQEYEQLGHMHLAPSLPPNQPAYFLPHHSIFRPGSKKIRVVFNASQKCASGYSLNDTLYPGPKLQSEISIVITLWRFHRIAMSTDIVKMYRQILVHPEDLDWQRLVWRETSTTAIREYRAKTVTYGTTCAPFLAIRSLIQLAADGQTSHPNAARLLLSNTYIDDVYLGHDDEEQTQSQRDELIALLATAGMTLGKWSSNRPQLLHGLLGENVTELPTCPGEITSALGLKWDTGADAFLFRITLPPIASLVSKRAVLSDTARLYDPLGFISPVIVQAKVLLQDLWISQLDWDVPLPRDLLERWLSFRSALSHLAEIKIPRWLGVSTRCNWQLHGFADASKRAYAAVLYAVVPGESSILLMAKTKVAPVKVETIPRLELCAATLLVRLAKHLLTGVFQMPQATHFWSDSKVVLDWLRGHPSRWPTFVANRVSTIVSSFPDADWRHVSSKDNAADCASRGMSPVELAPFALWWKGPDWLARPPAEWPAQPPEVKIASFLANAADNDELLHSLEKFSHAAKLVRVLAYCLRWKPSRARGNPRVLPGLSVPELTQAKFALFRLIQAKHFFNEYQLIKTGKSISPSSPLARLSPFVDEHGLLRVGGRLQNSALPRSECHPIILPGRSHIVRLLVEEVHRITLHGGVQLMKSLLNRSYWILRGARLISEVYWKCVKCIRFGARPMQQMMAPLPADRLSPRRPFSITGLDFAGPFPLLFSKGRGAKSIKGYVAIFICFVTKAIHLEVVSDLTTDAFLAAFARFTTRRGLSSVLYSDNGTTFKGADAELQRLFHQTSSFAKEVFTSLAARGTEWHFIPPRAPHFGGLWEAAVRSFKHHLRRVVGSATFTYEEFATLAAKIEACLNSRPICPLSNEANDPVALTPGHFLIGSAPLAYPEPIQDLEKKISFNKRWQLINQLRDSFWLRWRTEALSQMQQRSKWLKPQPNLKEGDLVILTDELAPPAAWPLAVITQTHPGKDGLVRVVSLRTAKSEFTRPITKLVRLPPDEEVETTYALLSTI